MDINLIKKLDEVINIFENSYTIKRLEDLKKQIYQEQDIRIKINRFNQIKDNIYSQELVTIRQELLENKLIKEYKQLENELFLLTLNINKKLNSLIDKKGC